jgi:hypothetical protein
LSRSKATLPRRETGYVAYRGCAGAKPHCRGAKRAQVAERFDRRPVGLALCRVTRMGLSRLLSNLVVMGEDAIALGEA